jgi:hypothetical protein
MKVSRSDVLGPPGARALEAAGIGTVDALDTVAAEMRRIMTRRTVKARCRPG